MTTIIDAAGDNTMIGKIANLASGTAGHQTSLQVEVHRLVKFVAILAFCTGLVLFAIGLIRKMAPIDAFVNGFILVIVANVPEGLPATVTSCLALTAMRLKEKQVLIKRTDIIENLGCATIIASDKTGTLTQNKMTVENIWCNCELHNGATFLPPPPPPAMPLARSSLARMSAALKQSIGRISRHSMLLSRTSLAKASIAGSASMMVGRKAVLSGELLAASLARMRKLSCVLLMQQARGDIPGTCKLQTDHPPAATTRFLCCTTLAHLSPSSPSPQAMAGLATWTSTSPSAPHPGQAVSLQAVRQPWSPRLQHSQSPQQPPSPCRLSAIPPRPTGPTPVPSPGWSPWPLCATRPSSAWTRQLLRSLRAPL